MHQITLAGRLHHRAALLCAAIVFAVAFSVAATTSPVRALNVNVTHYTLDNGMQVVVVPDHRSPTVTHMVWYKVGSADEPQGKAGIAHFLEHLMFKGTQKIGRNEFSRIVKRNGGQDNAFTSRDFTAYFQRIAKDRLDLVMGMEADRMANLQLTDEDVIPERAVVQEERRSRTDNNPSSLLSEQLTAQLYMVHPYRKPVIGWMSEVHQLTREDALNFYRQFYTPQNAILVVAGDVTADEVRKLADKHFAPLKNTANPGPRARTQEPKQIAARRVEMKDPRVGSPSFRRFYLAPSFAKREGINPHALDVLAEALGAGSVSRLYRELVVKRKLAAYAGSWYSGDALDNGSFGVVAAPVGGRSLADVEAAVDEVLKDVIENGLTREELDRAKNKLMADAVYALDSQFRLAYNFGVALTTGQKVSDVTGWAKNIEQVTGEDVLKAARFVLRKKRSVTGLLTRAEPVQN